MLRVAGLTPAEKYEYISAANFDDEESKETATALIENEGEKIGDLVSILKDEALEDNKALEEISEATDVDVNIIKDAAETKLETDEAGDAEGLDKEEKQELFSQVWRERMWDSIGDRINAYENQGISGFLTMFSEETVTGEENNEDKDTVEAIKIVKYVDEEALEDEGAEEVADIIAEATDGDKEAIQEVIEEKQETIADTAQALYAYFSEVMGEMAVIAGVNEDETVKQTLAALEQAGEEEAKAIEDGENFLKESNIHGQKPSETALTNTDPMQAIKLSDEIGNRINAQINQAYQISNSPSSIQLPNVAPGQNFGQGFNYQRTGFNPDVNIGVGQVEMRVMPGAPESVLPVLQGVNFAASDSDAIEGVVAMIKTASMILK